MAPTDFWVGPIARPDTYRLISMLGGGGEGEVWQAVLPLSAEGRSLVAVKILHPVVGIADDGQWENFGRLLRSLSHPGLVRVTDVFTGPGVHREGAADPSRRANFVVMDYIEGPTLREWCDENPEATAGQRLRMLRTVASALDEMHSGNRTQVPVAHGDVKPSNVVVRDGHGTVLVDLGLARLADAAGVVGRSAAYAAPELLRSGAMATPGADRYAFAVTAAQVLTGQPPPTRPDGWLDRGALESLLRVNPVTSRRPMLIRQILQVLDAPPEARPRDLRRWLDSAADTLSQVTTGGPTEPVHSAAGAPPSPGQHPAAAQNPTAAQYSTATNILPVVGPDRTEVGPAAPGRRRRRRWPLVLAAVVLLLVAGGAGALLLRPAASTVAGQPASGPLAAATTSAVPTTDSAATVTATTDDGAVVTSSPDVSATGLPTTAITLDTVDPVDSDDHTGSNGGFSTGPASTSGVEYGHAVTTVAYCSNNDGGDYWIDYNLGRGWSTFATTIGLRDDSPAAATATYKIIADNKVLSTGALALGTATPVTIPVAGILRLRLQINQPTAGTSPCSSERTRIVWGNPTLSPVS